MAMRIPKIPTLERDIINRPDVINLISFINFINAHFYRHSGLQMSIPHRWKAVYAHNLIFVSGNQDSIPHLRLWRVLNGTL